MCVYRIGPLLLLILLCLDRVSFSDDSGRSRFQGTWKVVKCVENGTAKPEETDTLMTIEGSSIAGEMIFRNRKATEIWSASIIAGTEGRRGNLDLVLTCRTSEAGGGRLLTYTVLAGIYVLSGDERNGEKLIISVSDEGGKRPTGFEPKKGQTQWTFKRVNME